MKHLHSATRRTADNHIFDHCPQSAQRRGIRRPEVLASHPVLPTLRLPPSGSHHQPAPFADHLSLLNQVVAEFGLAHPRWHLETLALAVHWALSQLKARLEETPGGPVTWDHPFVTLSYPVAWDWSPPAGDFAQPRHVVGAFTPENTASDELLIQTIGEMVAGNVHAMAFFHLTRGVWFEQVGGRQIPVLSPADCTRLDAISDPIDRQAALDDFLTPFSIGASLVSFDEHELTAGEVIPPAFARQLHEACGRVDVPRFVFSIVHRGQPVNLALIFQIHPLIADYDRKEAYHTIKTGLFFEPEIVDGEPITANPATWSPADREALWTSIVDQAAQLPDLLRQKRPSFATFGHQR
jgi:hypothetical protein